MRLRAVLVVSILGACDGGAASSAAPPQKSEPTKAASPDAEARKQERERKQKEEEEAKAALDAKLEELAKLPEEFPKKIDKACAEMVKAYDGYMRKVLQGDMLTKWETGGNEMQIAVFKRECMKFTPEVAACQKHAFEHATPDLKRQIPDFMRLCKEKFAPPD